MTRSGKKTCRWRIWKEVINRLSHKLEIKKRGEKIVSLSDRESSFGLLMWHAAVVSSQEAGAYKLPCTCGTTHISQTSTRYPLESLSTLEAPEWIAQHSLVTKYSTEMKQLNFDTVEFVANVQVYVPCIIRKVSNEITKCPYNWNLEDE
jgi:hypothetical protein